MKAANTVFWCSFFVNQRGCPRHQHKPLFDYLIENNNHLTPNDKEFYQRDFIRAYDELLNKFVDLVDDFCEEWVDSEAGLAFIECYGKKKYISLYEFSNLRKSHKPRPELTGEHLISYNADDEQKKSGVVMNAKRI